MTAGFFISACGSIVAFSGSFVDGLVSGAVGLILNGILIGLITRHKVMSNIFELTAAGVIAFIAVSIEDWDGFCFAAWIAEHLHGAFFAARTWGYWIFLLFQHCLGEQDHSARAYDHAQPHSPFFRRPSSSSSLDGPSVSAHWNSVRVTLLLEPFESSLLSSSPYSFHSPSRSGLRSWMRPEYNRLVPLPLLVKEPC
jgi:hypothetical protein